jgi:hypothetical protein
VGSVLNFDESIAGQNWVARALDRVDLPPIESPWPVSLQSALSDDYAVYLPDAISGEVAAGEMFIAAERALELAELGPPLPPAPAMRIRPEICSHTSFRIDLVAGESTPVYSANPDRGYSLIVNTGPNEVNIAYGAEADARGLPLAPDGDGFHELVNGTKSSLNVFCAVAGGFIHVVPGLYDPELEAPPP